MTDTKQAPMSEREMWRIAHKVSHFGPAWGQTLPPECPFCFPDPQERLVTDEEAMFLHDHVENDVVQALVYTREALMQALANVLDAHPDNRAYAKANARAFLNTLRGESND